MDHIITELLEDKTFDGSRSGDMFSPNTWYVFDLVGVGVGVVL